MLREMTRKQIPFTVIDPERSVAEWTIQENSVIGALTAMPGYGIAKAQNIIKRRQAGTLTDLQKKQLEAGITIYTTTLQDSSLIQRARESSPKPMGFALIRKQGGWCLGYIESRFLVDYTSPKMVKKYGSSKPGREKSLAITLADEQDSVKVSLTGRSFAALAERVEAIPDKVWALWNFSRWDQNGKLYLNDVRLIQ